MAVKAVLGIALLLGVVLAVTAAVYRYWTLRAKQRHEKEMLREERDAALLKGEGEDYIDRELQREQDE